MQHFLKDTFRPDTEEEREGIRRYHRRKAVVGLAGMLLALVMLACFLLPKLLFSMQLQGTWIPADEYADGYHAEDDRLEFRDDYFYLNGSKYGMLVMKDSKSYIPVYAPLGEFRKEVSVKDDTLTIRYTPPKAAYTYTGDSLNVATIVQSVSLSQPEEVVETYIRISDQCGLTAQEMDALY